VNRLYGLSRKDITPQQRLAGELDKIRFLKREKDFDRALQLVNRVLEREPDFPEALYLKAQILWEGFENRRAAESYLDKIIQLVKEDEPLYRWASGYLRATNIDETA
jgi:tetratricopeptide (TPR) repeat protein